MTINSSANSVILILFAFSDNLSAENSKSSADFCIQRIQLLECMHLASISVCIHLHPLLSNCVHLCQRAFTCVHLLPSAFTCIHLRISASTFIHLHPLLSTCTHFHPPASTCVHQHPMHPTTFTFAHLRLVI